MVRVPVRSYVGDITQFLQGTPKFLARHFPQAVAAFRDDVTDLGCFVSRKSVAVASSKDVGRVLQPMFDKYSLGLPFADCAKDLGTVTALSKRRATWQLKVRRGLAFRRGRKLKHLAAICGRSRKIFKPGVLSVGAWGHNVL
eukprot:6873805-Pyramimonas_sp.AAC.1